MKLALLEASSGKIGSVVDRFVLFCYHYDPKTRSYSMVINRVDDGGLCVEWFCFLAVIWLFFGGGKRRKKRSQTLHMFNEAFAGTLPIQGTDVAARWDTLYYFLIVTECFLFRSCRRRDDLLRVELSPPSRSTRPSTSPEAIFSKRSGSLFPRFFSLSLAGAIRVYHDMKTAPSDAYEIKVIGKQWLWHVSLR